tara:strand:- start:18155 stop:19111 length:957 start_codon:yes stop_codon:yes gene_type:complete
LDETDSPLNQDQNYDNNSFDFKFNIEEDYKVELSSEELEILISKFIDKEENRKIVEKVKHLVSILHYSPSASFSHIVESIRFIEELRNFDDKDKIYKNPEYLKQLKDMYLDSSGEKKLRGIINWITKDNKTEDNERSEHENGIYDLQKLVQKYFLIQKLDQHRSLILAISSLNKEKDIPKESYQKVLEVGNKVVEDAFESLLTLANPDIQLKADLENSKRKIQTELKGIVEMEGNFGVKAKKFFVDLPESIVKEIDKFEGRVENRITEQAKIATKNLFAYDEKDSCNKIIKFFNHITGEDFSKIFGLIKSIKLELEVN